MLQLFSIVCFELCDPLVFYISEWKALRLDSVCGRAKTLWTIVASYVESDSVLE